MPANRRNTWWRRLLLEHQWTKALSLILAIGCWYSVRGVIGVRRVIHDVPVEVRVRENMAVLRQTPMSIKVTFKGAAEDLDQVEESHSRGLLRALVFVTTTNVNDEQHVEILPRSIEGAKGVRVVRVSPGSVTIRQDKRAEEAYVVRPTVRGRKEGVSVSADPAFVMVRGPERELANTETRVVDTEPIEITVDRGSFTRTVAVLPPAGDWVAVIEPPEVQVTVAVDTDMVTRVWSAVPVRALVPPSSALSVDVSPMRVSVVLTGLREVLDDIGENDFTVIVDCTRMEKSVPYELPLLVLVAADIPATGVAEPGMVQVVLTEEL